VDSCSQRFGMDWGHMKLGDLGGLETDWGQRRGIKYRARKNGEVAAGAARGKGGNEERARKWRWEGKRASACHLLGGGAQDPRGSRSTLLESPQWGLPRFFMHRC
jgi:hypothetical protein